MNEIESQVVKMYSNAGIKKLLYCDICRAQEHALGLCAETKCEPFHPPFTAEKQLELIKWLAKTGDVCRIDATVKNKWFVENEIGYSKCFAKFEEALANVINIIWEYMQEEGRKQIRDILKD